MRMISTEEEALDAVAVKEGCHALWQVPGRLRTAQVCLEAVKNDRHTFSQEWKKVSMREPTLLMDSANDPDEEPPPILEETCLAAVRLDGRTLQYVPAKFKTENICIEAVKSNGMALYYVPEALKNARMCLYAVKSGAALGFVPDEFLTGEQIAEDFKGKCLDIAERLDSTFSFTFNDVVKLSDRCTQKLIRELDSRCMAKALAGADTSVQDKFFRNMSKHAASMLKEDMEYMQEKGLITPRGIEGARQLIVLTVRELEDAHEIFLDGSGDSREID